MDDLLVQPEVQGTFQRLYTQPIGDPPGFVGGLRIVVEPVKLTDDLRVRTERRGLGAGNFACVARQPRHTLTSLSRVPYPPKLHDQFLRSGGSAPLGASSAMPKFLEFQKGPREK